ncbi:MAG: LysM peptidoglycan-binding domain-containing protein, partial [Bacillota bacterium]
IGKAVSLGCIRMYNHDIEAIFPVVTIGTEVEIISGAHGSGYPLPPYNPTTTPASNTNQGGGGRTYTVQKGDTLWAIAKKLGFSLQDLIKANPGINPDILYPGQVINLP